MSAAGLLRTTIHLRRFDRWGADRRVGADEAAVQAGAFEPDQVGLLAIVNVVGIGQAAIGLGRSSAASSILVSPRRRSIHRGGLEMTGPIHDVEVVEDPEPISERDQLWAADLPADGWGDHRFATRHPAQPIR